LRSLVWTNGYVREHWDWKAAIDREGILSQISSFGVDADGELFIVSYSRGVIYRLVSLVPSAPTGVRIIHNR
jgi:hypothetical protein